jgi:Tol biopolymer transport system component
MQKRAQTAGRSGFVREVDEPSSRGILKKVSSDECDVSRRLCISADGKYVLYAGSQGKTTAYGPARAERAIHLWKLPASGGSAVKITSGGVMDCEYPSYTADGKHILYSSGGLIWKIQENGAGGRTRIPGSGSGNDFAPSAAKDGRIAFCSSQMGGSDGGMAYEIRYFIWICDANGGNLIQLREGRFPTWSPNSDSLTFEYDGEIWTIKADGTELTQLTNTSGFYEGIPSFSPDGSKIAYISNEGKNGKADDFNIWEMKVDGSEKTQITELRSWDSWPCYGNEGIYFISARAAKDNASRRQRIWKLDLKGNGPAPAVTAPGSVIAPK